MFCRSLFVPLYFFFFFLPSVLLRYTDSDYPFGIFKLLIILNVLFVFTSNPIRFYADQSFEPQRLHSFDDVSAALAAGKTLWYNALFFLCQGVVPWSAGGGQVKGMKQLYLSETEI
jgi:hypothetical protein